MRKQKEFGIVMDEDGKRPLLITLFKWLGGLGIAFFLLAILQQFAVVMPRNERAARRLEREFETVVHLPDAHEQFYEVALAEHAYVLGMYRTEAIAEEIFSYYGILLESGDWEYAGEHGVVQYGEFVAEKRLLYCRSNDAAIIHFLDRSRDVSTYRFVYSWRPAGCSAEYQAQSQPTVLFLLAIFSVGLSFVLLGLITFRPAWTVPGEQFVAWLEETEFLFAPAGHRSMSPVAVVWQSRLFSIVFPAMGGVAIWFAVISLGQLIIS